jgi:hypothetical protein
MPDKSYSIFITPLSDPPSWGTNICSDIPIIFYESPNIQCYMEYVEDYLDGDSNKRFIDFRNHCMSMRAINGKLALIHIVSSYSISLKEMDRIVDTMNDINNELVDIYKKINFQPESETTSTVDLPFLSNLKENIYL